MDFNELYWYLYLAGVFFFFSRLGRKKHCFECHSPVDYIKGKRILYKGKMTWLCGYCERHAAATDDNYEELPNVQINNRYSIYQYTSISSSMLRSGYTSVVWDTITGRRGVEL